VFFFYKLAQSHASYIVVHTIWN